MDCERERCESVWFLRTKVSKVADGLSPIWPCAASESGPQRWVLTATRMNLTGEYSHESHQPRVESQCKLERGKTFRTKRDFHLQRNLILIETIMYKVV